MACNITRGFSPSRRGRKIVRDGRETEKRGGEGAVMVFPNEKRRGGEPPYSHRCLHHRLKVFGARGDSNGYCACGIRRKGGEGGGRRKEGNCPMLLVVVNSGLFRFEEEGNLKSLIVGCVEGGEYESM